MSRACFSGHDLVGKIDNWSFLRGIVVFSSEFLDLSMIAKLWKFDVTADQAPHSGTSLIIPPMVRQSSRRYIFNGLRNYNSKPCSRFANRPPPLQTKSKFRSLGLPTYDRKRHMNGRAFHKGKGSELVVATIMGMLGRSYRLIIALNKIANHAKILRSSEYQISCKPSAPAFLNGISVCRRIEDFI